MTHRLAAVFSAVFMANAVFGGADTLPASGRIELPGLHRGHLQDVWKDGKYIYWMQTQVLYKTDLEGNVLIKKEVKGHHAGCEVKDGHLFVAVCQMQHETGGKTLPSSRVQVYEYDTDTLTLVNIHDTDINDRAGSFCFLEDGTCLVGCLRHPQLKPDQVRFHHLDRNFKPIESHVLDNVKVKLGIEVIKRRGDHLYLFMYKGSGLCVKLDKNFRETGRFDHSSGTVGLFWDGDNVWTAKSETETDGDGRRLGYKSSIVRRPDLDEKLK